MKNEIVVAALQNSFGENYQRNVETVTRMVRAAAERGAQVILPPELFESVYFCKTESEDYFALARPIPDHPTIAHFQKQAKELGVVLPISIFERDDHHYYNSLVMIDADGGLLGVYRKSHIPDGPGYEEKFYFRPGHTGFKSWRTRFGNIGVGICWDQWYPECARAMMLQGAEILLYPTAIGSEPHDPSLNTKDLWQKAMIGHAVSNVVPVIAANRVGNEEGQVFYGHSFICGHRGELVQEADAQSEAILIHKFDLDLISKHRAAFGFFRDRRPDLYQDLIQPR